MYWLWSFYTFIIMIGTKEQLKERKEDLRLKRLALLELGDYTTARLLLNDIQELNREIYPKTFGSVETIS